MLKTDERVFTKAAISLLRQLCLHIYFLVVGKRKETWKSCKVLQGSFLSHRLQFPLDLQEEKVFTTNMGLFDLQEKLRRPVSVERARGELCGPGRVILARPNPSVLQGHPSCTVSEDRKNSSSLSGRKEIEKRKQNTLFCGKQECKKLTSLLC